MSQGERNIKAAMDRFRSTHKMPDPSFNIYDIGPKKRGYQLALYTEPTFLIANIHTRHPKYLAKKEPYISSLNIGLSLDPEGNVTGLYQDDYEKAKGQRPQFFVHVSIPGGTLVRLAYEQKMNDPSQSVLMEVSHNNERLSKHDQERMLEELREQNLNIPTVVDAFETVMNIIGEPSTTQMKKGPFVGSKLKN